MNEKTLQPSWWDEAQREKIPTKYLGAEGSLQSPVALVGEAWGSVERAKQAPFQGPAGRLLRRLLIQARILSGSFYMTNVIKEQPKNNNIKHFVNTAKGIETEAYKKYKAILKEELSQFTGNVICAVGQVPLYALTGLGDKITKRRGSIYESTLVPGKKVIPIIHPSGALRQYSWQRLIQLDLAQIREDSAFPELRLPNPNIRIHPRYQEALDYIEYCEREFKTWLAFDIETPRPNVELTHFAISPSRDEGMSIAFKRGSENVFSKEQELYILKRLAMLLANPSIPKLAQNGIFDYSYLFHKYGMVVNNMDDTMVGQGICFPEFPKGLDFLCSIYTRHPYYKDEGKQQNIKGFGSDEVYSRYNAKDAIVLHDIMPDVIEELKAQNNTHVYNQTMRLIHPLVYMQEHGVRVDVELKEKMAREASEKIERMKTALNEMCGQEINVLSKDQVATYFYIEKGLPPYKKKGKVTTDETALIRIANKGHEEARLMIEIRKARTMLSRYYKAKLRPSDNRLVTAYNPLGAPKTSRLSSSKNIFGEGMNCQNQPYSMKECYLPD